MTKYHQLMVYRLLFVKGFLLGRALKFAHYHSATSYQYNSYMFYWSPKQKSMNSIHMLFWSPKWPKQKVHGSNSYSVLIIKTKSPWIQLTCLFKKFIWVSKGKLRKEQYYSAVQSLLSHSFLLFLLFPCAVTFTIKAWIEVTKESHLLWLYSSFSAGNAFWNSQEL